MIDSSVDMRGVSVAYPSKYNGTVDVKISIVDGVIKRVSFDNANQCVTYDKANVPYDCTVPKEYRAVAEEEGYCVADIMGFMAEYLESCCIAEDES